MKQKVTEKAMHMRNRETGALMTRALRVRGQSVLSGLPQSRQEHGAIWTASISKRTPIEIPNQ
jgi:hypothetical protein